MGAPGVVVGASVGITAVTNTLCGLGESHPLCAWPGVVVGER